MADIIDFPFRVLTPTEIGLDFIWNSRDGGAGLNGVTQIVSPLSGLWEMSILLVLGNEARTRTFDAYMMEFKGRFGRINFPIFDPFRVRRADAGWPSEPNPIPFGDGTLFSDGTGFALPDITTTVAAAGTLGDEEITLEVDSINDALGTGHRFSINDYLHIVRPLSAAASGGVRTFKIGPPLRADVAVDTEVKVGRPSILCQLADDRSGAGIRRKFGRFGEPSMEFIEVLDRE